MFGRSVRTSCGRHPDKPERTRSGWCIRGRQELHETVAKQCYVGAFWVNVSKVHSLLEFCQNRVGLFLFSGGNAGSSMNDHSGSFGCGDETPGVYHNLWIINYNFYVEHGDYNLTFNIHGCIYREFKFSCKLY